MGSSERSFLVLCFSRPDRNRQLGGAPLNRGVVISRPALDRSMEIDIGLLISCFVPATRRERYALTSSMYFGFANVNQL